MKNHQEEDFWSMVIYIEPYILLHRLTMLLFSPISNENSTPFASAIASWILPAPTMNIVPRYWPNISNRVWKNALSLFYEKLSSEKKLSCEKNLSREKNLWSMQWWPMAVIQNKINLNYMK